MTPVEFDPTISVGEQPQNDALDGTATVTGRHVLRCDIT